MRPVRAKKSLGQHFLTDMGVAERIASTLDAYVGKNRVLEVGPGMGVLTQFLLSKGHNLNVVEIDRESVAYLNANFEALQGRIIADDFLRLDWSKHFGGEPFCIIGNYPYNISSQIFFKALEYKDRVPCISGMLQREVAQRICAAPGSKTYGILSVLLQAWYDVEYLFTVDEHVFNPPPKVKSGVIRLTRNSVTDLGCDERLMRTVVKTAFGQRRKTLRNSLKGMFPKGDPVLDSDLFKRRPEQLAVSEFIALTNLIEERRKSPTPKF